MVVLCGKLRGREVEVSCELGAPLPSINGERGEPWAPLAALNSSNGWRKAEGPLRMVLERGERVAREGHWRESEKGAVGKGGERTCDVCSGGILAWLEWAGGGRGSPGLA